MSSLVRSLPALASLLAALAVAETSHADAMPPPQDCEDQSVGDPCTNAGTSANEAGLCLEEMCTVPNCDAGAASCEASCMLCEAIGSGSGSSARSSASASSGATRGSTSESSGNGSGASGDAGNGASPRGSSSGCMTAPDATGTVSALVLVPFAVIVGRARRRRDT